MPIVTNGALKRTTASPIRGVLIASPGGRNAFGGIGSVTRSTAEWFEASGADMDVFVVDPRGRGARWLFPFFFTFCIAQVIWIRAMHRPNILHLQISERGSFLRKGLLLFLARSLGMKVIVHHHGAELIPFYETANPAIQRWVAAVARKADLNIVLGAKWGSFLSDVLGVDPGKIEVLFNATPRTGTVVDRGPRQGGTIRFLVLAAMLPRKGITEFLASMANLYKDGVDVTATLAGSGQVDRYRKECEMLGISDICTFTGWLSRDGVDQVLSEADVMVLPSYEEGLPMAILEALSAGLPVIATRVGSIPEVLVDEDTALLVEPRDVAELTRAMRKITLDAETRARLAKNGLVLFNQQFEMQPYIARLISFYHRMAVS